VGVGKVFNTRDATMLHNSPIPPNHVKVMIDVVVDREALLPIPLDEDTAKLGEAVGTCVAWPINLVVVDFPQV